MTTMICVYLGYLIVCVLVAVAVARALRIHGVVYMTERSSDSGTLIKAKTHLMVVGFYLLTLGTVGVALRYGGTADDARSAIELLSTKIGFIIFVIGFMHFVMIGLFATGSGIEKERGPRKRNEPKSVELPSA